MTNIQQQKYKLNHAIIQTQAKIFETMAYQFTQMQIDLKEILDIPLISQAYKLTIELP